MLEKRNNKLCKNNNNLKQNNIFWGYTYMIMIAVIFITIGFFFPNDFTFFGIPGLGIVQYIAILYLFCAVAFWYNNKNKKSNSCNILIEQERGD
jgi:hypothetical protein